MSSVKLQKGKLKAAVKGGKPKAGDFILIDNQDNTYSVHGVDAGGNAVDISAVATLTATSSDPAVLSADPPVGMTGAIHGLTPGTAVLTLTATWNDGSVGPFSIDAPGTVSGSAATGLAVDFGTPTIRP